MNQPINSTPTPVLFTIRLWQEDRGEDRSEDPPEWRGKITNLYNHEVRYFRDSETLYGVMVKMMGNEVNQMTVTSHRSGWQDQQQPNNERK